MIYKLMNLPTGRKAVVVQFMIGRIEHCEAYKIQGTQDDFTIEEVRYLLTCQQITNIYTNIKLEDLK